MSRLAHGVLLSGFPGTHVPEWLDHALRDGLAGVCLFAENTPDIVTTRVLTDALRRVRTAPRHEARLSAGAAPARTSSPAAASHPAGTHDLIVAIDEEGGDVTRLQASGGSALPGNAALGLVDDEALTRSCAAALGRVLALAGVNLDLAPCLDVASEPLNPVIGVRSFGADPHLVTRHGRAFAVGLAEAGVACCGKHYPGHGSTRVDSHLDLPVMTVDDDLLRRRDEGPFLAVLGQLDAVMTGHLVVTARGREAASLSPWATTALRTAGLTGPVVTDALGMRAITDRLGLGEACVRALAAGADLLCLDAPHLRDAEAAVAEAVAAIDAAVASGRLDPGMLAASAARNAALALRAGAPTLGPAGGEAAPDPFEDAVEAAWNDLAVLGAQAAHRAVRWRGEVVLTGPPLVFDIRRRTGPASGPVSSAFDLALRNAWVATEVVVPLDPAEITETLDVAPVGHDVVVLSRAARADRAERAAVAAVLAVRPDALVVHTGVVEAAPEVPRLVCTLGNGAANADALVNLVRGPGEGAAG